MNIEGFTNNKLSYENIKTCLIFRDTYTAFFNAHQYNLVGTVYENVYTLLKDLEYCLNSGVLDDPSSPEYEKCLNTVRSVATALEKAINVNSRLSNRNVTERMRAVYDILRVI